jgi:hypothetical protein
MAVPRSRRLRLLDSLRQTLSELLHTRVRGAARRTGSGVPCDTSTIYTLAASEAPDLLDQLLLVHQRASEERGETVAPRPPADLDDSERRRMLSAVRATVRESGARFST